MSNYYEYEEYSARRRPRSNDRDRDRDPSPDNYSGGANNAPPPPGAPPYASTSRLDDPYAGSPPRERMTLEPPPSQARPRSVPPQGTTMVRRGRSRASSFASSDDDEYRRRGSRSRSRKRSPSPLSRARGVVDENFTNSTTGIGAGLLGAVVGGLVAREATEAATRRKHKTRGYDDSDNDRTRMISTILGAVAGGLGANAIANRVEDSRERDRRRQQEWEHERRNVREEEMPRYEQRRSRDFDNEPIRDRGERRILPPRNEDEDDYDFVYDEPRYDDRRPARRRSEENYRYRQ